MKARPAGRSAACTACGKTFARSDTLLRHEKSHHNTEDRGPIHRVTDGTFRACTACAAARSRCSGGTPCGRCNLRRIECSYPSKRRKAAHENHVLEFDCPTPNQHTADVTFNRLSSSFSHESSLPDRALSQQSSTARRNTLPHQPLGNNAIGQHPINANSTAQNGDGVIMGSAAFSHVHPEPMQPLPNQDYPTTSFPDQFQDDFANTPYGYSAFEDSMNWIPISVYPSPYENEFEHDVSFLFPSLPDSTLDFAYHHGGSLDPPNQAYGDVETSRTHEQTYPVAWTGTLQSPASSASNEHPTGRSTSSSAGSRETKRKSRKSSHVSELFMQPRTQKTGFGFPNPNMSVGVERSTRYCSPQSYDTIASTFRKLCLNTELSQPFESSDFPSIRILNSCIDLYFEKFHPTFPLIHEPTFSYSNHWLVLLATAAVGTTFVKEACAPELREAFQELLRRTIIQVSDGIPDSNLDLPLAQARILSLIGLTMSERDQLRSLAPKYHADLSRWCLESGILQMSAREQTGEVDGKQWEPWIYTESLRRVGYFSWLLDTSLGYLANCRPLCNMDDARTPLPCSETLWSAASPEQWKAMFKYMETPPSLCTALENMYTKKSANAQLSDISQTLLINALFQRTWEVGTHIKQPLSEWVPTGKARGFLNTPSKDSFWLPLYPLYANWRNSACDCLDVISWQAASTVAKASGVEHDLMLHLHLARIILLTPFQEIQDLLFSLIGRVGNASKASFYVHDGSYQPRNLVKLPQIRKITWRWLREDQHKARLAMVHAGSVFWHIRRYSSGSFYEPLAVYLASMVLWTYGSYKSAALERDAAANHNTKPVGGPSGPDSDLSIVQPSRVERKVRSSAHDNSRSMNQSYSPNDETRSPASEPNSPRSSNSESSSETDDQPEFIHLDRPCDDEMVQHFVRNGHNMSGHMANVGDICTTPNKVLLEGAKLLRTKLGCWGVSREYYDVLMKLYERK